MATKTQATPNNELPTPVVGEPCPCCGRKVTAPKQSDEQKRDRQREYNQRPEVKERQKQYRAKRNAEIAELREIRDQLKAQEEAGK